MDKTTPLRVSVEDELLNDHLDEIREHYEETVTQYYSVISDKQIREIIRDELKKIEMEKLYND